MQIAKAPRVGTVLSHMQVDQASRRLKGSVKHLLKVVQTLVKGGLKHYLEHF